MYSYNTGITFETYEYTVYGTDRKPTCLDIQGVTTDGVFKQVRDSAEKFKFENKLQKGKGK